LSSSRTFRNHKTSQFTLAIDGPAAPAASTTAMAAAGSAGPSAAPGAPAVPGVAAVAAGPGGAAGQRARARTATLISALVAALAAALVVVALAPLAPAPASASTTPKRIIALRWAEHQAGKWYCWGGAGPSCFDCSGLVMKAYAHAGIKLPRTTAGMLRSSKLRRIRARNRQRGDLAFYGNGHVELVTNRGTFGALESGTRIGWHHPSAWWHPTKYFRVRT